MKFEKPIVEIEKFALKDIISASGEGETTPSETPQPSSFDTFSEGHCQYNSFRDNDPNDFACG